MRPLFLKLTRRHDGETVYVNANGISSFSADGTGSAVYSRNKDGADYAAETPEQIMAMINGETLATDVWRLEYKDGVDACRSDIARADGFSSQCPYKDADRFRLWRAGYDMWRRQA